MLGTVYRVRILTLGQEGRRGQRLEDTVGTIAPVDGRRRKAICDKAASKTSSSSSSSSSNKKSKKKSKKKKSKKAKKSKKEKKKDSKQDKQTEKEKEKARKEKEKENERQTRASAKENDKQLTTMRKVAGQVCEKLQSQMPATRSFMADRKFGDLPLVISSWITEKMEKWSKALEVAELARTSECVVDLPNLKDRMRCLSIGLAVELYCLIAGVVLQVLVILAASAAARNSDDQ